MRAHVELTPAERRVLSTLTQEERQEVVQQMVETVAEELEWQLAVEQARAVAETVPATLTRVVPPPVPPPRAHLDTRGQRYRWPSYPARMAAGTR
jgi:hypothetical protein